MRHPEISIIIPVFNTEKYLEKCVMSILNQTFKNIEVICINDGSSDNSEQVLKKLAAKDSRLICINQKNEGLSAARNTALDYVTGNYIMYVDSDDWIGLNTCELLQRAIVEENADVALCSYIREFSHKSLPKKIFKHKEEVLGQAETSTKLHRRMFGLLGKQMSHPENADAIVTVWAKLYKTDIIKNNQIKFISTKIIGSEDALFNIYYFGYVKKSVCLSDCLYHYRKDNEVSVTTLYKERLFIQNQMKYDLMEMYIEEHSLSTEYKKSLTNRIALSLLELGLNIMESEKKPYEKITKLKKILSHERYKKAFQEMDYSQLPFYWKLFYGSAKLNFALGVYGLLWAISKLRNKSNTVKGKKYEPIKIQAEVR
ncbi:MAG: glycosyltransferase family 2 protein [Carnobacterium sp.]|uniref:glycosyltransferase family 2 protein n=1 Tax=Carnobacterium sp. TaxID=48221 RepID=UPI003C78C32A